MDVIEIKSSNGTQVQIIDQKPSNINLTQSLNSVIEIVTQGPQGPQGPAGRGFNPGDDITTTGYVSASVYYGDGSNLTGITTDTGSFVVTASAGPNGSDTIIFGKGDGTTFNVIVPAPPLPAPPPAISTSSFFTNATLTGGTLSFTQGDSNVIRLSLPSDFPYTGSAEISGSLSIDGFVSASTYYGDGSNLEGVEGFPYTGSAEITGSLGVTGNTTVNGDLLIDGYYKSTNNTNTEHIFYSAAQVGTNKLIIWKGQSGWQSNLIHYLGPGGANQRFGIEVGNTEALSITNASKNVGIGTISPQERLHVVGNVIITGSNSLAGSYALRIVNSSGTNILSVENNGKTSLLTPTLNGITTLDTGDIKLEVSESRIGNAKNVVFKTFGATGGWKGGYDFRTGYNDSTETTSAFKIIGNSTTTNSVGIGDFALNILESADAQLVIEKNILATGSKNSAIRILNNQSSTNASEDSTYSGIQFDSFSEDTKGGAFIGTQASTYSNGYETDFVILATGVAPNSYSEIARFVGWNKSFYIGENRNIISSSYKLQVDGAVSASTYYGDGSNLTGINTGSWDGIFTGSAAITGSLRVTGNITGSLTVEGSGSTIFEVNGSEGQLFSITDSLSGSLFAVSDVSGLPILEVFSDDRIVAGAFNNEALVISGSHTTLKNTVVSGSLNINGTVLGSVTDITPTNQTASLDCSLSNFFTLTLSSSADTFLTASNIQPGQTINLRITQPATSGSLSYGSEFKFPNGLPYSVSATGSVVDILSFIAFDSNTLYGSSLKNFV